MEKSTAAPRLIFNRLIEEKQTLLTPYKVLSFTLQGRRPPLAEYRHDADFTQGDERTIQYEGEEPIEQIFQGSTDTGGWYDF